MLRKYMSPYEGRVVLNAIVKVFATIAEVVLPVILAYIIDTIIPLESESLIYKWGFLMIGLSITAWIMNIIANRMASRTVSWAIQNIRKDLFERSMTLSSRQMDQIGVSSLESRLTSDTYVIHRFLGATLRMGIRSIMIFLGGVVSCFYLSPKLASILLFLIIPLFIVIRTIFNRAHPLFRKVQVKLDEMVQVIRENIRGIKVSKALNKTEYEKERYKTSNDALKDAEIKSVDTMAIMSPMVNSILYGGLTIVLIWGASLIDMGLLEVGVIVAFLSYFIQITNSLLMMNRMFNVYNRSRASSNRIQEVLEMPLDENQIIDGYQPLPQAQDGLAEIEFRNVSFSYLGKNNDLEDISFKLYKGQKLGIMGSTGSGKSTIIRLLLRQYNATSGQILIRGVNINKLDKKEVNKMFGIVFQNDFLFRGTIRDNINFGRDLDDIDLLESSNYAQAREFIDTKNGGLDFHLESKGVNLSGGQKQRLLLARALANQPKVLILDDSSSALDFKTDANLRQALKDNFSTTTSIIVAQRVSSVIDSDQIIFLNKGRLEAAGDHHYLLENCQAYREIAQMQLGHLFEEGGQDE